MPTGRNRPTMAEQRSKRGQSDAAPDELPELLGHPVDSSPAPVRIEPAVELALRARWTGGADGRAAALPVTGASCLRERFELRQSARQVARELDPLTELAVSSRRTIFPAPDLPVLDAYLVQRDRIREFVARVAEIDESLDEVELTCTGP